MSLTRLLEIWINQRNFFKEKSVEQIISMAGDGILRDGNETSTQLREFFSNVPTDDLEIYTNECLEKSFQNSGLVLQDLVNEVGNRLGFSVEPGFYRGGSNKIGFDGVWRAKDGYAFVIEVKTTDAYQMNLDTFAEYRNRLIDEDRIKRQESSVLIIVGRKDTGGLEAQTRGSRHAYDIRIISIDALLKILHIKENLSDAAVVAQIHDVLKPFEYTRLDRLVDVIFQTSGDIQAEEEEGEELVGNGIKSSERTKPVNYHDACIDRISHHLKTPLIKEGRSTYVSADKNTRVICLVSKEYKRARATRYWYAFHPTQQSFLNEGERSYVALGCGSADKIILLPAEEFQKYLDQMRTTIKDEKIYWHVEVFYKDGRFLLMRPTEEGVNVDQYKIP